MADISKSAWLKYTNALSKISEKAANELNTWIDLYGNGMDIGDIIDPDGNNVIDVAYILANKYGNASSALAAQMYDAIAEMSGVLVEPAEQAEPPTYHEVAKTVNGVLKTSQNPNELTSAVGRLVKRTGADTTLLNAGRDGAQFAWIPMGDTCAFCITLASRGWQYMSKDAMKNGHAEHIHSNCDCEYAVRFDEDTNVKGYDPDKYYEQYKNAEGSTPEEKINSMRRKYYAENREEILAQKADAYAKRMELNSSAAEETKVN